MKLKEVKEFYKSVLGLEPTDEQKNYTGFSNDNTNFYVVEQGKCPGLMIEFAVEDRQTAMEHLKSNGCEIILWEGKDKDCHVRDPFGLIFNLTQKNN